MKKFENPMLQVVSIKKNDIITGSDILETNNTSFTDESLFGAADRFRDWDAGY